MSIIQDIREKYAKVSVVAIALALIGFILTDYFSGQGRAGGGNRRSSLGSVNGKSIKADPFAKKVEAMELNMRNQGYPGNMLTTQAVEEVWRQEVNNLLLEAETGKLGMTIGKKELGDILYGPNMPPDLKQQLSDESGYDPVRAKQKVDQMLRDSKVPQEQKDNFNNYVEQLKVQRLSDKYVALHTSSIHYPRWFLEKQTADNSQIGKVSLVRQFYTEIPDSTIKIEDKEIADFVSKHKKDFKQEESRSIAYVNFNAAPSAADSAAVKNQLLALKPELDTTSDTKAFLGRNGVTNFFDGYVGASQMFVADKDSIQRLSVGQVYGPYLDGSNYTLAKMIEIRTLPDSVKCRHILLGVTDRNGQPVMPDSVAKFKADSVAMAIRNGVPFEIMEMAYSTDQAARATKGEMTFSSMTIQGEGFAKEFGQFILFDGKPGDKKVLKTQFGWHYIEILSFIKPQPAYKVGYLRQEILASQETDSKAQEEANQFAADSRDQKAFDANFEKTLKPKGMVKGIATSIKPNDGQVQGVGFSRSFVRNIYDAKKAEVLKPERVDNNYVVAVVTEIFEEGTQSPATARMNVEPILRNKKKAEMIRKKLGTLSTLEAAAAALGNKPIEVIDSVRMDNSSKIAYEPKVCGATFNPANKGKLVPEPLAGQSGIYVVRVDSLGTTAVLNGDIAEQRRNLVQQMKQYISNAQGPAYPINVLRNTATIRDRRSNRY